jgi:molybdenum cofactor cytidylyltransferase
MARIGIIVLAAGRSTRFGASQQSKLVALVDGVPIVRRSVTAALDAGVGDVVVVTGHQPDRVISALDGLHVRAVHEPRFGDGMAASLRRGVREFQDHDAVLIGLADQPAMRAAAYRRVAERWRADGSDIVVPRYAGSSAPAHPPLFSRALFDELLGLQGDVGARTVIANAPERVQTELLEWSAPDDVDTIEDLALITYHDQST